MKKKIWLKKEREAKRFKDSFLFKNPSQEELKGRFAEDKFRIMVVNLIRRRTLPWLRGITKSSLADDFLHKIDFRLRTVVEDGTIESEFQIPIQVKSSWKALKAFRNNEANDEIHAVVIGTGTHEELLVRNLTNIYHKEIERRANMSHASRSPSPP